MFTRTKIVSTAPRCIGVYLFDDDPPPADDESMDLKHTTSSSNGTSGDRGGKKIISSDTSSEVASPNSRSTKLARGDSKKNNQKR